MTLAADFVERVSAIVGRANLDIDLEAIVRDFAVTGPDAQIPVGIVRPASAAEVAGLVKAARDFRVPLYPISRGRNWGYGDAAPPTAGQVIVDLSRMDRIRHIDDRLGYAVIEPGVTQGALARALKERGGRLWCDSTGAGPEASIVGNVLERGFGHTAYGDRVRSVSGLEVVLGDGRMVRTGFSSVRTSAAGAVYPYGTGPYLDGMFTQSAFGIVTEMTVWLMPAPDCFKAVVGQLSRYEDIFELVERLRPLRLDGTLKSVVHIGNDLRLISGRRRFPRDRVPDRARLPEGVRAELRTEFGAAPWSFSAALTGDRAAVRAAGRRVRRALSGMGCKLRFVDDRKLRLGRMVAGALAFTPWGRRIRDQITLAEPAIGLLKGEPTDAFLTGAYWRNLNAPPTDRAPDPGRDGCGLYWHGAVLPATREDLERLLDLAEALFAAHDFDFLVTLGFVNPRSLSAVMTIAFDRTDEAEAARAEGLYRELVDATARIGYPGYRANSQAMEAVVRSDDPFWATVGALKQALDPDGIIAPGRYSPDAGLHD